jgi:hypothetical protein
MRIKTTKLAKAVKEFSYACKIAYPEEAAHVEHQLTLTHRHRNLLTETLLKGREKYRDIIKEHLGWDIKPLEEQAEEITTEIKAVQHEISAWKKQNRTTKTQEEKNKAKVAIEVGWRLFETGLRVAVAPGEDGDLRELYLPKQWLDGKRKAESLGSIIDRGTNQTALAIKAAHPELCKKAEQPEQLEKPITAATPAALVWAGDSPRRLAAALLKLYRENPTLQPELEEWRKQHFHLLRYKKGCRTNLCAAREIYRKFVSGLAKKYSICGIEDFDLCQVTRKDSTKDQAHELVKWQRTAAGISSLRLMLSQRLTAQKLFFESQ